MVERGGGIGVSHSRASLLKLNNTTTVVAENPSSPLHIVKETRKCIKGVDYEVRKTNDSIGL